MDNAKEAIKEASRVLKRNGRFIFSITHPLFSIVHPNWIVVKLKGRNYFARVIPTYLSLSSEKVFFPFAGNKRIKATQYHRSLNAYFSYLKEAGFLVSDFREITTKKPVTKASREDGDVSMRRSKYAKISEKKMKEFAGSELPLFLVVGVVKF